MAFVLNRNFKIESDQTVNNLNAVNSLKTKSLNVVHLDTLTATLLVPAKAGDSHSGRVSGHLTLGAGSIAIVNTTAVNATSLVFLTPLSPLAGQLSALLIPGTGFSILSNSAESAGVTVSWLVVN